MRGFAISLAMSASVARVYPFFFDFFCVISSSWHASTVKNGQFRAVSQFESWDLVGLRLGSHSWAASISTSSFSVTLKSPQEREIVRKQFMQIESTEPSLSVRWANLSGGEVVVCKLCVVLTSI
jgi:hypothetical protein